jgi:sugar O-acyltransferase (sialic acid O-acetyltransferase NeuD family)
MPTEPITLVGAGGHALVVLDALSLSTARSGGIVICTEDQRQVGREILGHRITLLDVAGLSGGGFHVCIGHNDVRRRLFTEISEASRQAVTIAHPRSIIADSADIGAGAFIGAGAVLAPKCRVGRSCIVNHGAIVDHEVEVGDFTHIGPGVTIGGAARIGSGVLLGAGANILPGVTIGENAAVGAGAVVLEEVPVDAVYVGVPARRIR